MKLNIFDLMDSYEGETYELETVGIVSAKRVKETCMNKINKAAAKSRRGLFAALIAAVMLIALSAAAVAGDLFSSLDGDDASFAAVYNGGGKVSVRIENKSDKKLELQNEIKLMRYKTNEEIKPISKNKVFDGALIEPHGEETFELDLSAAYDIAALEEPIGDDWYYIVLTNNHFVFGQDWTCGVDFAPLEEKTQTPEPPEAKIDENTLAEISDSLKPYFENVSFNIDERRALNAEYGEKVSELLKSLEGEIVPSVEPTPWVVVGDPEEGVIFDGSVAADEQYLLISEHRLASDWNFKLLATEGETPLVISVGLPLKEYDAERALPLFFLFAYEKDKARDDSYAFVYGQVKSFKELEEFKVHEDEDYVYYEMSALVYKSLESRIESFAEQNPDVRFDEGTMRRIENVYEYYKENIGGLIEYR